MEVNHTCYSEAWMQFLKNEVWIIYISILCIFPLFFGVHRFLFLMNERKFHIFFKTWSPVTHKIEWVVFIYFVYFEMNIFQIDIFSNYIKLKKLSVVRWNNETLNNRSQKYLMNTKILYFWFLYISRALQLFSEIPNFEW